MTNPREVYVWCVRCQRHELATPNVHQLIPKAWAEELLTAWEEDLLAGSSDEDEEARGLLS